MFLDGVADLLAEQVGLPHADGRFLPQFHAVLEQHDTLRRADFGDLIRGVFGPLGAVLEVVARVKQEALFLGPAARHPLVQRDLRLHLLRARPHFVEPQERAVVVVLLGHRRDFDLLDQPLAVGVERREPVDQVINVPRPVRRAVAEREQRVQGR